MPTYKHYTPFFMAGELVWLNFLFLITFHVGNSSALPACTTGSIQVRNCVRYRCEQGLLRQSSCAPGLVPTTKDPTGCAWPSYSECTTALKPVKLTDPCTNDPCVHGSCIASNDKTAYVCVCQRGYRGRHCDIDINDCITAPCKNGGTCHDLVYGYSCSCSAAFTGTTCETPVSQGTDLCASRPCLNGGTCTTRKDRFQCTCLGGFTGKDCGTVLTDRSPCSSNPCQNDGFCVNAGTDHFYCICRPESNFTGPTCETIRDTLDPCSSQPCENKGLCFRNGTSFLCFCIPGYTGNTCSIKQDPCTRGTSQCQHGATCIPTGNMQGYVCQCASGFQGILCDQVTTDSCSSNPCKNGGVCVPNNERGSFTCSCPMEYTGNTCDLTMDTIMTDECRNGGRMLPHPTYCQLYYNCSSNVGKLPGRTEEKYLDECPYPELFDAETRKCESFNLVNCGSRKEIVDYCGYWRQTRFSVGRPCEIDHPSCLDKKDGMQEHPFRVNTPSYITCFKNRTTLISQCEIDNFGVRKQFKASSSGSGSCKSVFEMALEDGGRVPKCETIGFTLHSDPARNCSRYYFCLAGKARFLQCKPGKVFKNTLTEPVCQDPSLICPPCGTKVEGCAPA